MKFFPLEISTIHFRFCCGNLAGKRSDHFIAVSNKYFYQQFSDLVNILICYTTRTIIDNIIIMKEDSGSFPFFSWWAKQQVHFFYILKYDIISEIFIVNHFEEPGKLFFNLRVCCQNVSWIDLQNAQFWTKSLWNFGPSVTCSIYLG